MNIFDYLPVNDLIIISELNARFVDIILEHYIISKYHLPEKSVFIFIRHADYQMAYKNDKKNVTITTGLNHILWVLEHFGYIFNNLLFDVQDFGSVESQDIFKYNAKYCTQAVKTISIQGIDSKAIANWTHSFDENTTHIQLGATNYDAIPLNEFFPFMQEISVFHISESIAQHFPHLTKCSIDSAYRNDYTFKFIHLNPKLRHFHTSIYSNERHIKYLNRMLPNLESLAIGITNELIFNLDREIIHFKNVKAFSLNLLGMEEVQSFRRDVFNITFDQLETFTLKRKPYHLSADLLQIIAANSDLKKVETNLEMRPEQLVGLVQALPELKEMTLYWHEGIISALQALLSGNHKIEKILVNNCFREALVDLAEISPTAWEVVANDNLNVYLLRKNSSKLF